MPYKGAAALNNDLIGGHIPAVFSVLPASLGAIRAGALKVLAMTGTARIPLSARRADGRRDDPGLRSCASLWPAGARGHAAAHHRAAQQGIAGTRPFAEVQERINNEAGSAMTSTPEEYAAEIVREDALWGPLIRGLNIKVE